MLSCKGLREWCRFTCASYPNVDIQNFRSSFRDGLAFCAIIHQHRPDLIDFSSLSKNDAYINNKLAFEVAESKLGIPALLDPKNMLSAQAPDALSVITYLALLYYFFAGKFSDFSKSSHAPTNILKTKSESLQKLLKSSVDLETDTDSQFAQGRTLNICSLCFKLVHLIQKCLIDERVYHRRCLRCKLCHCTLFPGAHTRKSDAGFLTCAYHQTASENETGLAGLPSLRELTVTTVPQCTDQAEQRAIHDGEGGGSSVGAPLPPRVSGKDTSGNKNRDTPSEDKQSELSPTQPREAKEPTEAVTVSKQISESSTGAVPTPRTKPTQTATYGLPAGGSEKRFTTGSTQINSLKVRSKHPWMNYVHPGPWTQLPPAPAPIPAPRSKSIAHTKRSWNEPRNSSFNPFDEEEEIALEERTPRADPTNPSRASVPLDTKQDNCAEESQHPTRHSEEEEEEEEKEEEEEEEELRQLDEAIPVEGIVDPDMIEESSEPVQDNDPTCGSDETERTREQNSSPESCVLSRSLSVPAVTSQPPQTFSVKKLDTSFQSKVLAQKLTCKQDRANQRPKMFKSNTFQDVSSSRSPAPGHGFPLIKRKVRTGQDLPMNDLQVQMKDLDKTLEGLEQRGVELERNLRACQKGEEEEPLLAEWFSLVYKQQILSSKCSELGYLMKQQRLEDRQADVEFELRRLLNKPESTWSQEDRNQEQQLMDELVAIIEQRNQIISCLEQNRQREKVEDFLDNTGKNQDFKKEEVHKSKPRGKFKSAKVFKLLSYKPEKSGNPVGKKD